MACLDELHIDDVGTLIKFYITECEGDGTTTIVDITNATVLTVRFRKSDRAKTVVDKVGSVYDGGLNGNGTDGIVSYITEVGLVDVTGTWKAQAIVEFANGAKFHSSIVEIPVVKNL